MSNNKFRIGKDLSIVWSLLTNGEPISLESRHLALELTDPMGYERELSIQVEGCVVKAWFLGDAQKRLGVYKLTLWENRGKSGQTVVDNCNAFELVRCSDQENGGYDLGGCELRIKSCLAVGVAGQTPAIDPVTRRWIIGGVDTGVLADAGYVQEILTREIEAETQRAIEAENGKQEKLISGKNVKTINGQSIVGPGNISIETGRFVSVDEQDWGEKEKNQARKNINAASVTEAEMARQLADRAYTLAGEKYKKPADGIPAADLSQSVRSLIAGKQEKLIPGENITIEGNVISSKGGAGGGIPEAPKDGKVYGRKNGAWEGLKAKDIVYEGHLIPAENVEAAINNLVTYKASQGEVDALSGNIRDVKGIAEDAKAIAEGKAKGYVFDTKSQMEEWLSDPDHRELLHMGDNLYIIDTNVPDYWWDGTQARELETQKVDLTQYLTKEQIAALYATKAELANKADKSYVDDRHVVLVPELGEEAEGVTQILNAEEIYKQVKNAPVGASFYVYDAESHMQSEASIKMPVISEDTVALVVNTGLSAMAYILEYNEQGEYHGIVQTADPVSEIQEELDGIKVKTATSLPATNVPADNTIYNLGEVALLVVAGTPADNKMGVVINFHSGSSATQLQYPASTKWNTDADPTIDADADYQLTILDGVFAIAKISTLTQA